MTSFIDKYCPATPAPTDLETACQDLHDAVQALRTHGFRTGNTCPKDGSDFEVIELSTAANMTAFYSGEWPDGHLIVAWDGDSAVGHPDGYVWRPHPKKEGR